MKKQQFEKAVVTSIGLISGSLLLEGLTLIILQIIFHNYMSQTLNVITIALSIVLASVIYPYILLKRMYTSNLSELGIKIDTVSSTSIFFISMLCIISILCVYKCSYNIVLLIIQNIFVAIGEEFVARGCLFYLLRKIVSSEYVVIIISTFIFVFVFHSNSSLSDNLIWRLPITIVLSILYSGTHSIINTSLVHMTYNVIVSL